MAHVASLSQLQVPQWALVNTELVPYQDVKIHISAEALTRARFEHSYAGRAMQMFVSRPLSAVGVTPSRLKEIDESLLRGRGLQTFRKLRWLLRS